MNETESVQTKNAKAASIQFSGTASLNSHSTHAASGQPIRQTAAPRGLYLKRDSASAFCSGSISANMKKRRTAETKYSRTAAKAMTQPESMTNDVADRFAPPSRPRDESTNISKTAIQPARARSQRANVS